MNTEPAEPDDYERTTGHLITCLTVAGGGADDSDDPEHIDDCPGCEAFTLTGHTARPPAADRAAILREAADICDEAASVYAARGADDANSGANTAAGALFALMERFQRKADEAEYVATPCAPMVPCEDGGEPCHVHERLMAHAEGDHELCEPDCGVSVAAEAQQQPAAETPTCPDPIECAHEAALGQAQQQVKRVRDVCDQLRRASVLADGEPHTDRERGIVQAVTRVMAALDRPAAGSGRVAAEARPETVCSESVAHIADAVERSAAADTDHQ